MIDTQVLRRQMRRPFLRRVAGGMFWTILGSGFSRGFVLLASIVAARFLGKTGYGEFAILQSTALMVGTFANLGLGLTTSKLVAQFRGTDPARASRVIGFAYVASLLGGAFFAGILMLAAPWVARDVLGNATLAGPLRIAALALVPTAVNTAQMGILGGLEAFRSVARVGMLTGLATLPLVAGGVYALDLEGAVLALVLSQAFSTWVAARAIGSRTRAAGLRVAWEGARTEWRVLGSYGLPVALAGALATPTYWACNALLVNQSDGYAQMGVFNAAYQWRTLVAFIPEVLYTAFIPMLSNLHASDDRRGFRRLMAFNAGLNGSIAVVAAALGALFSSQILAMYGPTFVTPEARRTLIILLAGVLPYVLYSVVGQVLASLGRMWTVFMINAIYGGSLLIAFFAVVPAKDSSGLAVAHALANSMLLLSGVVGVLTVARMTPALQRAGGGGA